MCWDVNENEKTHALSPCKICVNKNYMTSKISVKFGMISVCHLHMVYTYPILKDGYKCIYTYPSNTSHYSTPQV